MAVFDRVSDPKEITKDLLVTLTAQCIVQADPLMSCHTVKENWVIYGGFEVNT